MDAETWLANVEELAEEQLHVPRAPRELTIVFDPECELCRRCRDWMFLQPSYLPLAFVPCSAEQAKSRYGEIPWLGDELVVISEVNDIWVGAAAFLTCLWALVEWREWSYRLAGPAFAPLAESFFHTISSNRRSLSSLLTHRCKDGVCQRSHRAPGPSWTR